MTTRRIIGTLTDAAGTPLAGYTLTFTALASTPTTLAACSAHAVTLDSAGGYDVSLLPGRYAVTLSRQVAPWPAQTTQLGIATVDGGPDIDLLTLIAAPGVEPSEIQHLLDEVLALFDAAEAAVSTAVAARDSAEDARDSAEAAQLAAESARDSASGHRLNAQLAQEAAQDAEAAAEAARDAAFVNAAVYADIAAGLAATSVGQQLQVVSGNEIIRYRHDAGPVATEVARYPSAGAMQKKRNIRGKDIGPCTSPGVVAVIDGADDRETFGGKLRTLTTQDGTRTLIQPDVSSQPKPLENGALSFKNSTFLYSKKTAKLLGQHHLPSVSRNPNPSGGFTNTGLARDDSGLWIVGHQGRTHETSGGAFLPTVVILSPDRRTILQEIAVEVAFPGSQSLQGVAWDSTDDTIWIADNRTTSGYIRHLNRDGTDAGVSIALSYAPNGLAFHAAADELYVSGANMSGSLGDLIEVYDASTGNFVRSLRFPSFDTDHIHCDGNYLYFTRNVPIGTLAQVVCATFDGAFVWDLIDLPGCEAVEGVFVDGDRLFLNSDGGFHTSAKPPLSLMCEYEIKPTPPGLGGNTVLLAGIFQSDVSTSADATIFATGNPTGALYAWSFDYKSLGNTMQFRNNSRNQGHFVVRWPGFNTRDNGPMLFSLELTAGESLPNLYINGVFVASNYTKNDLATSTHLFGLHDLFVGASDNTPFGGGKNFGNMSLYGLVLGNDLSSREEVEGWLAHRYNLASLLPGGHPFKTSAPI